MDNNDSQKIDLDPKVIEAITKAAEQIGQEVERKPQPLAIRGINFAILAALLVESLSAGVPIFERFLPLILGPMVAAFIVQYFSIETWVQFFVAHIGWGLPIAAIIGALVLFWLRGFSLITYGLLEVLVGLTTITTAQVPEAVSVAALLPFSGGIYIVIRGLDNVAKALDPDRYWGSIFSYYFNNPKRKGA